MLDQSDLERWLAAYGAAWEKRDPDAAARLFTAEATYQETPYDEPMRGRDAIHKYWSGVTADQADITFTFDVLGMAGMRGFAQWSSRFRSISGDVPVELNGIFVLEFEDAGQVSALREWWHAR
jgi:hypothetical protein